jgi:hypothetical protein
MMHLLLLWSCLLFLIKDSIGQGTPLITVVITAPRWIFLREVELYLNDVKVTPQSTVLSSTLSDYYGVHKYFDGIVDDETNLCLSKNTGDNPTLTITVGSFFDKMIVYNYFDGNRDLVGGSVTTSGPIAIVGSNVISSADAIYTFMFQAPTQYLAFHSCDGRNVQKGDVLNTCYKIQDAYYRRSYSTQSNGYASGVDKVIVFVNGYDTLQDCTNDVNRTDGYTETYASQCGHETDVFQGLTTGPPTTATAGLYGGTLFM